MSSHEIFLDALLRPVASKHPCGETMSHDCVRTPLGNSGSNQELTSFSARRAARSLAGEISLEKSLSEMPAIFPSGSCSTCTPDTVAGGNGDDVETNSSADRGTFHAAAKLAKRGGAQSEWEEDHSGV